MSKFSSLTEWYTIPDVIEYFQKNFNETILEKQIYEWAINDKIILSIILPQYTFSGTISYEASQQVLQLRDFSIDYSGEYTDSDFEESLRSFSVNYMLFTPSAEPKTYSISGLWNIATTKNNGYTEFLMKIYNWLNNPSEHSWIEMREIALISPQSNKCALLSRERHGENNQIMWSLDPLNANSATIIITKENLNKFLESIDLIPTTQNNFIKEVSAPDLEQPIKTNQYNNLVSLIGFLLKHRDLIPTRLDDHTVIVDKLLTAFDTHTYDIYGHETLTKVIKDALRLIEERNESKNKEI